MHNKSYWVYILYCDNNCYYTGYTSDLMKRYEAHLNGSASKYTRSFKPLKIAQHWKITDKSIAIRTEYVIKKLSRRDKEKIIANPELLYRYIKGASPLDEKIQQKDYLINLGGLRGAIRYKILSDYPI